MLTGEHITVRYGKRAVVDDLSFRLDEGEWLMLAGPNGAGKTTLIRVLMNLAGCLGVPTIVEGVEEREQVDMLKSAGCDIIQGYYFSRPLPPEEFERFIKGGKEEC